MPNSHPEQMTVKLSAATSETPAGALEGLRVIDLGGSIATQYCAKLFADYGAEVINLEPADGFATRLLPPHIAGETSQNSSALHGWLNAKKRSVTAGALSPQNLNRLLTSAALVLDDGSNPGWLAVGNNVRSLISWFGEGESYANYTGSDGVCFAMNGMLRTIGRIEGPPLIPTGYQAQIVGGNTAFIGSLGEVLASELGNRTEPVTLETSILEAMLCFTEVGVVGSYNTGLHAERMGVNRYPPTYPMGVYPCKDGWLGVTALTPSQWHSFCGLLDMQEFAQLPLFQTAVGRLEAADVLEPMIQEKLLQLSAEDVFYRGQNNAVPLARVPSMEELFQVDQFVERNAFTAVNFPAGASLTVPATPFRLFATPPIAGGAVAELGAHTGDYQHD